MQAIFDEGLVLRHKKRALAAAVGGADFLLERAAVEMAERLSTVERRFDEAALLFCLTPTAREAVLASGKVYSGLTVASGSITLPGGATATKMHVGRPFSGEADFRITGQDDADLWDAIRAHGHVSDSGMGVLAAS